MRRMKTLFLAALLVSLSVCPALAAVPVRMVGDAAPFEPGAELLHLYVLDLMGGDCMLLQYQGQNLLIDVGGENQYRQLRAMLDWLEVEEAALFNSHPHGDHVGGLAPLMEDISIPAFYTCFDEDETLDSSRQPAAVRRLKTAEIPIHTLGDGDQLPFEGGELIIHQQAGMPVLNDCSAMVHLRFQNATMLLTADISQASMYFFSSRKGLRADIMKAPHHGVEPIQARFLRNVDPQFVFFTNGSGDTRLAWEPLRQERIPHLFATRGVIHFSTDGKRWLVEQLPSAVALAEQAASQK